MAEYKSFGFLMHKMPEQTQPNYVSAPTALTFDQVQCHTHTNTHTLTHTH
jgi:hypothetical protein